MSDLRYKITVSLLQFDGIFIIHKILKKMGPEVRVPPLGLEAT
jgi:hypothetical protein